MKLKLRMVRRVYINTAANHGSRLQQECTGGSGQVPGSGSPLQGASREEETGARLVDFGRDALRCFEFL